ncbi:hypothetical protein CYR40_05675 [Chimaeribacter arupi]|uniref:Lar family restriction alleviation protein n=1 Tax=Chimaeribacter arupi TaxID=2060066 RepID=UPI000C79E454|nr:Lar family restriction alleviation protein [Chimaeribacter arupi]PLR48657.1 hypothetical protein CYR40_05675 [Chimaeribacter arupi]
MTNNDELERELKPCPFCGKKPEVRDGTYSGSAIHVSCRCGAQLFGGRNHFGSEDEAINAWNERSKQED